MRKLISVSLVVLALGLAPAPAVFGQAEVHVEKKTTHTGPYGTVVVESESSRTFKLQGHTEVYTAPPDVDLKTWSGKEVNVTVGPDGKVTKIEKRTTVY